MVGSGALLLSHFEPVAKIYQVPRFTKVESQRLRFRGHAASTVDDVDKVDYSHTNSFHLFREAFHCLRCGRANVDRHRLCESPEEVKRACAYSQATPSSGRMAQDRGGADGAGSQALRDCGQFVLGSCVWAVESV